MVCFQVNAWCAEMHPRVKHHIGQFEDADDFKLDTDLAICLAGFFRSLDFTPFLTALDTDQERVAVRRKRAANIASLKEKLAYEGRVELHRWTKDPEEFDADSYPDLPYPMHPVAAADWVHLRKVLMVEAQETNQILPRCVNDLARYVHNLHYKVDHLMDLLQGKSEESVVRDWENEVARYPFLSECDDHVRSTPTIVPILLARTSAGDGPDQTAVRTQRDTAWRPVLRLMKPVSMGGKNCTLNRMPDSVKIDLVNAMARGPAFWSANITMRRTESHISTKRFELKKKRAAGVHTYAHIRTCTLPHKHEHEHDTHNTNAHTNIKNTQPHTTFQRLSRRMPPPPHIPTSTQRQCACVPRPKHRHRASWCRLRYTPSHSESLHKKILRSS
jgi:hypothetical protein